MKTYIWQQSNWPQFTWDEARLLPKISDARLKQGRLIQKIQSLAEGELTKAEALILEEETLKTAQIEGEKYNPESVRSSIHRRLGLDYAGLPKTERHIDGLVEVLFNATTQHDKELTLDRLKSWQAALFPTGYSGMLKIKAGKFRTDASGPMQVVSGPMGRETVHYEAPPADRLEKDLRQFLLWWYESSSNMDGIIRAGVAHFYFITLHPFEDGNGRLARALTDMALAQDDKLAKRYYSLSSKILNRKRDYYNILERSQKSDLDITEWLIWFIDSFETALGSSQSLLASIFDKAEFWNKYRQVKLSDRQRKVVNALLDAGKGNFEGSLTTRKYVGMTKVSRATAIREINDLLEKDILTKNQEAGRSVNYDLNW